MWTNPQFSLDVLTFRFKTFLAENLIFLCNDISIVIISHSGKTSYISMKITKRTGDLKEFKQDMSL